MLLKKLNFTVSNIFVLTLAVILFSLSLNVMAADQEEKKESVLATINDVIITLAEFNQYWDMIPENYKSQLNKTDVLDQLITQKLLLEKANQFNLKDDPDIAIQIENTVNQILIQSLIQKEIVDKVVLTDEDIQQYYNENKDKYYQEEEVHILDILVETEEKAQEILQQLEQGAEFSKLAKENSIASSAANNGDVGFITKGTLTEEIEKKIFELEINQLSDIIPTEKGYHIFKVIEKNDARTISLEEVKEEIKNQLLPIRQKEAFDLYLEEANEAAKIEKNLELLEE